MFGVGRDGRERFSGGMKENAVHDSLVLQGDVSNLFRYRKHNVKIRALEKLRFSVLEPLGPSQRLTLWTVTVRTRIEPDALVAAPVAHFDMAAEGGGAALFDCCHHPPLRCGQQCSEVLTIGFTVAAEYVRQFRLRAWHRRRLEVLRRCRLWVRNNGTWK